MVESEDAQGTVLEVKPSWRGASHEVAAFIFPASDSARSPEARPSAQEDSGSWWLQRAATRWTRCS